MKNKQKNHNTSLVLRSGSEVLDCSFPKIMGILNITPDSFYDGGRWMDPEKALERAVQMIQEGANLIDVGAESSRPGAEPLSTEEELSRLIPILEKICRLPVWVSIDTYKLEVMKYAYSLGVKLFNNIRGFASDEALEWAAQNQVAICIMHMHATPATMAKDLFHSEQGVVAAIAHYLNEQVKKALDKGLSPQHIVLDPGFGFGKSREDNYRLLTHFSQLIPSGYLSLVGMSNKRMVQALIPSQGASSSKECLMAGANANSALYALLQGAKILRVHNVALAKMTLNFYESVLFS